MNFSINLSAFFKKCYFFWDFIKWISYIGETDCFMKWSHLRRKGYFSICSNLLLYISSVLKNFPFLVSNDLLMIFNDTFSLVICDSFAIILCVCVCVYIYICYCCCLHTDSFFWCIELMYFLLKFFLILEMNFILSSCIICCDDIIFKISIYELYWPINFFYVIIISFYFYSLKIELLNFPSFLNL